MQLESCHQQPMHPILLRRPRNFAQRRDIFDQYDDVDFKKRYRVNRVGLVLVTSEACD